MKETLTKESPNIRLGFKKFDTIAIVQSLNKTLAAYQIFFHKLQSFHWNVLGNEFMDIHDITEEMYKKGLTNIDEIAERVRIFGQYPEGKLSAYLKDSIIKESSTDKSGEYMIYNMISDIEKLSECLLDTHENAAKMGDIGTIYLLSKIIKDLETYHWKLSAWTSKKFA